jgi:hypothetical protein
MIANCLYISISGHHRASRQAARREVVDYAQKRVRQRDGVGVRQALVDEYLIDELSLGCRRL